MKWMSVIAAILIAQSAAVSVSPQSGEGGDPFALSGSGFAPGDRVRILWDGANLGRPVKADGNGTFSYSGTIPAGSAPGAHTLTADGRDSGQVSITFTVVPPPTTTTSSTTTSTPTTTSSTTSSTTTTTTTGAASPTTTATPVRPPATTAGAPSEVSVPADTTTSTAAATGIGGVVTTEPDTIPEDAAASTPAVIREDGARTAEGTGGFLAVVVGLAGLAGGITLWIWRRRGPSPVTAPAAEPAPAPTPKQAVIPPVAGREGEWSRHEIQVGIPARVNALAPADGALLALGETDPEGSAPPRATVWRQAEAGWVAHADLGAGAVEHALPWREGLLLAGSVRHPEGFTAATWWSQDRTDWTRLTADRDSNLTGITFDGIAVGSDGLVAYGRGPRESGVWSSPDATAWRPTSLRGVIDLVAAVPAGFVAFGRHPERRQPLVARSPDGLGWDSLPTDALFAFEGISMATLVSFDGGLVAAGTDKMRASATVWVSDDAIGWLRTPFDIRPGTSIEHLVVADGRLVAVGSDRGPQRTGRPGSVAVWESADAVTWERLGSSPLFDNAVARSVHLVGGSLAILGHLVPGYESPWPRPIPVIWTWERTRVGASSETEAT